jgi:alpha-galactosidase
MWQFQDGFKGTYQHFEWYTAANHYIPFVLCTDRYGANRFSAGFTDQILETSISGDIHSLKTQDYQLKLRRPLEGVVLTRTQLEDAILLSTRKKSWFDVVERYCTKIDELKQYKSTPIPDAYYEPQWNSWTPFRFNINEEGIWEYAKICKKLGIGMVSIDAGWSANSWDEFGDWVPKPKKFPNMRGLISRIQKELGMLVELFVGPFSVGISTEAYKEFKCAKIMTEAGESASLCPRNPLTKKHVCKVAYRVTKDLRPDFFLVDLTEDIASAWQGKHNVCVADHKHVYESFGEGYNECLDAICTSIKKANPETMIEACDTTNLNCKQFWPMTYDSAGGDIAFDFSLHQRQMVFTRSFTRGLVPKNSIMPWHMKASDEDFGKHMIQQVILGVPLLASDLKKLPESHAQIIKAWLSFYRKNRKELISGEFRPIGFTPSTFPHIKIEGEETVFLQLGNMSIPPITLNRSFEKIYFLNSTQSESLYLVLEGLRKGEYKVEIRDCFLNQVGEKRMSFDKKCYIDLNVPEGGLLRLEKI